jgi:hypothetical protein
LGAKKNQVRNILWTENFDKAFELQDCREFLQFINDQTRLKPLFDATSHNDIIDYKKEKNSENKEFPTQKITIHANTKPSNLSIIVDKSAHVQIKNSYLGNLFISRNELRYNCKMDSINRDIIADGARGFDPFDQEDWPKVIGAQWPTAQNTRDPKGVAKLIIDKSKKAVLLDTNDEITSSYGTKPRAMAILDNENDSVILAFQQENKHPNIDFAAWSILPFKIREGKKTFAVFPSDKKTIESFQDETDETMDEIRNSEQWDVDKGKFFVVDVSKPSSKTEYLDPYADWCIFATQDEDTICLARSCYKDKSKNKQFKVFSGQADLGGTKYVELEFIAPKVQQGEKSTLVYRIDFIPLKKIGIDSLSAENIDENMPKLGEIIDQKIKWARALAVLTLSTKD